MNLKQIIKKIVVIFFPDRCAGCDCVILFGKGVCAECAKKIRLLQGPTCMVCGKKVKEGVVCCYDCTRKKHEFIQNKAIFEYEDLRESLYRF